MPVLQKMSIHFFKQLPTSKHSCKMYIRHLFVMADFNLRVCLCMSVVKTRLKGYGQQKMLLTRLKEYLKLFITLFY